MKNFLKIFNTLSFILFVIAISSCTEDELPIDDFISFNYEDNLYIAVDVDVVTSQGVVAVTGINTMGQIFSMQFDDEITKGNYDIKTSGYPFFVFVDNEISYRSVSGNLDIDEHNTEEQYIRGSFEVTLSQEGSTMKDNIVMKDGEFFYRY